MNAKTLFFSFIDSIVRKKSIKIDSSKINKVLILRLGAIGDVLRTTPFVRELRKALPNAQIEYMVGNNIKTILEGNPNIDKIIGVKGNLYGISVSRLSTFYNMSRTIRSRKYDLVVNLEPHYLSQIFVLLCRIPIAVGWDRYGEGFSLNNRITYDGKSNEIEKGLEIMTFFGKNPRGTKLDIFLSKSDKKFAIDFIGKNRLGKKRIIGMTPGASKNEKAEEAYRRWSVENYAKLSERLVFRGYFLLFFGNRYDSKIIRKVTKNLNKKQYIDTSGKTSIKEAAALIRRCDLFIAHDSGPMHIAAAMNTPLIALFGPTPPRRAGPLTKNSYVIYKKYKNEPEKYDVWGKYINCDKETYMERITVEDVWKIVDRYF